MSSRSCRLGCSAALLGLLGCGQAASPAPEHPRAGLGDLVVRASSEVSVYSDTDHVSVVTPTVSATVENPLSGWTVGGSYLIDVVTAASVDIVATATPPWREARHVVAGNAGYKSGDLGGQIQASSSIEPDYRSLTFGGNGSLDLLQKNLTLLLGYSFGSDTAGRSTTPFSVFSRALARHTLNAGATMVLDRSTIFTAVIDALFESGNQAKPYRYVPMFEPGAGESVPVGASIDLVRSLMTFERPLEQLPLSRQRFALTGRLAHRFADSTLRLEERLYADSWGLLASTSDVHYLFDLTERLSFDPRIRFHLQDGVDFWRRAYELAPGADGPLSLPDLRTGDRELGPLRSFTGGLGAHCDLSERPGARRWLLSLQADTVLTQYPDALYISRRNAYFFALSLDATFE